MVKEVLPPSASMSSTVIPSSAMEPSASTPSRPIEIVARAHSPSMKKRSGKRASKRMTVDGREELNKVPKSKFKSSSPVASTAVDATMETTIATSSGNLRHPEALAIPLHTTIICAHIFIGQERAIIDRQRWRSTEQLAEMAAVEDVDVPAGTATTSNRASTAAPLAYRRLLLPNVDASAGLSDFLTDFPQRFLSQYPEFSLQSTISTTGKRKRDVGGDENTDAVAFYAVQTEQGFDVPLTCTWNDMRAFVGAASAPSAPLIVRLFGSRVVSVSKDALLPQVMPAKKIKVDAEVQVVNVLDSPNDSSKIVTTDVLETSMSPKKKQRKKQDKHIEAEIVQMVVVQEEPIVASVKDTHDSVEATTDNAQVEKSNKKKKKNKTKKSLTASVEEQRPVDQRAEDLPANLENSIDAEMLDAPVDTGTTEDTSMHVAYTIKPSMRVNDDDEDDEDYCPIVVERPHDGLVVEATTDASTAEGDSIDDAAAAAVSVANIAPAIATGAVVIEAPTSDASTMKTEITVPTTSDSGSESDTEEESEEINGDTNGESSAPTIIPPIAENVAAITKPIQTRMSLPSLKTLVLAKPSTLTPAVKEEETSDSSDDERSAPSSSSSSSTDSDDERSSSGAVNAKKDKGSTTPRIRMARSKSTKSKRASGLFDLIEDAAPVDNKKNASKKKKNAKRVSASTVAMARLQHTDEPVLTTTTTGASTLLTPLSQFQGGNTLASSLLQTVPLPGVPATPTSTASSKVKARHAQKPRKLANHRKSSISINADDTVVPTAEAIAALINDDSQWDV